MPQITYASLVFSGFNSKRYYSFLPPPSKVIYPKSNHSFVDGNFDFNEFNDENTISSFSTVPSCLLRFPGNWVKIGDCELYSSQWKNADNGELRWYNSTENKCYIGGCTPPTCLGTGDWRVVKNCDQYQYITEWTLNKTGILKQYNRAAPKCYSGGCPI